MKILNIRKLIIGVAMMACAGFAILLAPREQIAKQGVPINLESMIPMQFSQWRSDQTAVGPTRITAAQEATLKEIYSQTLSRTYENSNGERVMLSIAYGGNQSDEMQVHKPEICYPAQGFQLLKGVRKGTMKTRFGDIPVKRMVAVQGNRIEPVTYWITIGDQVVINSFKWKLTQLRYGLTGKVPDGLLFRVSSLGMDEAAAYSIQEAFVNSLLESIDKKSQGRLIGAQINNKT